MINVFVSNKFDDNSYYHGLDKNAELYTLPPTPSRFNPAKTTTMSKRVPALQTHRRCRNVVVSVTNGPEKRGGHQENDNFSSPPQPTPSAPTYSSNSGKTKLHCRGSSSLDLSSF